MTLTKALYFENPFCKVCLQPINACDICGKILFESDLIDCRADEGIGHVCKDCTYGGRVLLKILRETFEKGKTYSGDDIHEVLKELFDGVEDG
jgi:hypothetical protein